MNLQERIKKIVEVNQGIMEEYGSFEEPMSYGLLNHFKYNGHIIINPLYDETGKKKVNPIKYYGIENINKFILL